ncbi:MAG: hypothetical protein ACRDT8_12945 [Micromonosporaceae bacterium]
MDPLVELAAVDPLELLDPLPFESEPLEDPELSEEELFLAGSPEPELEPSPELSVDFSDRSDEPFLPFPARESLR